MSVETLKECSVRSDPNSPSQNYGVVRKYSKNGYMRRPMCRLLLCDTCFTSERCDVDKDDSKMNKIVHGAKAGKKDPAYATMKGVGSEVWETEDVTGEEPSASADKAEDAAATDDTQEDAAKAKKKK